MAKMLDRLSAPDVETALVSAALKDISVFGIDLDPADFSVPRLRSTWRAMQEHVRSSQTVDKALFQLALQQTLDGASLLYQIDLEKLEALYPDPQACAALVRDLAQRRRAEAELEAAGKIIYTESRRWRANLAASAARLQKLAMPQRPGGPSTGTSWSAADLLAAEFAQPEWAVPGLIPVGLSFLGGGRRSASRTSRCRSPLQKGRAAACWAARSSKGRRCTWRWRTTAGGCASG